MSKAVQAKNSLPSVVAFRRGMVITDAAMFNVLQDDSTAPVKVIRHGIVGTQNTAANAKAAGKKEPEVANLQETDTAKLDIAAEKLRVKLSVRFMPIAGLLDSCFDTKYPVSAKNLREGLGIFIGRASNSDGLMEVARRYVRNMVNGRWLWRNRIEATAVEITITAKGESYRFDALSYSLNAFSDYCEKEETLAKLVADCLSSSSQRDIVFELQADVDFGMTGAIEVYPSQNYLSEKPKGFARSLYRYGNADGVVDTDGNRVMGFAAIRDQKIGNALRTIDTWYPKDTFLKDTGVAAELAPPISVEPNGANLDFMRAFRTDEYSAFMMLRYVGDIDPNTEEGMFLIACLVRGGVYSNDDSKNNKAGNKESEGGEE